VIPFRSRALLAATATAALWLLVPACKRMLHGSDAGALAFVEETWGLARGQQWSDVMARFDLERHVARQFGEVWLQADAMERGRAAQQFRLRLQNAMRRKGSALLAGGVRTAVDAPAQATTGSDPGGEGATLTTVRVTASHPDEGPRVTFVHEVHVPPGWRPELRIVGTEVMVEGTRLSPEAWGESVLREVAEKLGHAPTLRDVNNYLNEAGEPDPPQPIVEGGR